MDWPDVQLLACTGVWQRAGMSLVMHDVAVLSLAMDVMERKWCTNKGKCCYSLRLTFIHWVWQIDWKLDRGRVERSYSGCVMFNISVCLKLDDGCEKACPMALFWTNDALFSVLWNVTSLVTTHGTEWSVVNIKVTHPFQVCACVCVCMCVCVCKHIKCMHTCSTVLPATQRACMACVRLLGEYTDCCLCVVQLLSGRWILLCLSESLSGLLLADWHVLYHQGDVKLCGGSECQQGPVLVRRAW